MFRIVGCLLIIAAGTGLGFSESLRLSERICTLEMLLQMVICLKGEISSGNASLPDAFCGTAGRMNGKYREFLINAANQDESGKRRKTLTDMQGMRRSHPEKKLPYPWGKGRFFFPIGKYLGYLDREMQLRQLSLYEKNLEVEIGNLKKEASGKKKLYRGLGVFGGLLLAVLLV